MRAGCVCVRARSVCVHARCAYVQGVRTCKACVKCCVRAGVSACAQGVRARKACVRARCARKVCARACVRARTIIAHGCAPAIGTHNNKSLLQYTQHVPSEGLSGLLRGVRTSDVSRLVSRFVASGIRHVPSQKNVVYTT